MQSEKIYRPRSWEQKEPTSTTSPHDAPEVYYGNSYPNLRSDPKKHGIGYATELPVSYSRTSSSKRRRLWLFSGIAIVLVLLALGLGIGLHFRLDSASASTTSQPSITVTGTISQQPTTATTSPPSTSTTFPQSTAVTASLPSTTPNGSSTSRSSTSATTSNGLSTSSSSTTITTSTTSTTAPVTTGSTGIAADDCTTSSNSQYTTTNDPTIFAFDCGADYPLHFPTYSGNGTISDLLVTITYTFEQCMEMCAIYNKQQTTPTRCEAITYAANLTQAVHHSGGNCWLKDARGQPYFGSGAELPSSAYAVG